MAIPVSRNASSSSLDAFPITIPVSRNASSSSLDAFPITGPDLHHPPPPSPPQDAAGVIDVTASFSSSSSSSSNNIKKKKQQKMLKNTFMKIINIIKTTLSMILILFSVIIISAAIVTKQTVATSSKYNVSPILALFIFWFSLCWLAIMEGGLNCIVGLQPIPFTSYKNTHHKTYLCTKISHKQNNIERFIVGRQYLDLMIVFLTSFMVSSIENANVLGLPQWINDIFLGSFDLAVILCTIVFGQLIAQINCAHSMLDFINNYGMVFSTYIALCVEASGILHAVYFVQIIFTYIVEQYYNNKRNKSNNEAGNLISANNNNSNIIAKSHQDGSIRKGSTTTTTLNTSMDSCTTHNSNSNSIIDSINNLDDDSSAASSSNSDIIKDAVISVEFVDVGVSSNKNINEEENLTTTTTTITKNNNERRRPLWKRIFFWIRVIFSLSISVFAIAVFSTALINGNTTIRNDSIPVPVSFISLFILLIIGGFMEALQIALFAVKHLPKESIDSNPIAKRNCNYILGNNNNNNDNGNDDNADENSSNNSSSSSSSRLQSFLVGRQIAQTVIMFMIARIITVEMKQQPNTATLFGVSQQIQTIFFDSGLLNALVTTIFASLSWRVTANCFPMLYLGSPFSIWIIRLCLVVEGTGICDAAWTIAKIPAYFFIIKSDEEYLSLVAIEEQQEQEQEHQEQHQEVHQEVHSHSQECDNNIIIKDVESQLQLQSQSQSQSQSQQQGM